MHEAAGEAPQGSLPAGARMENDMEILDRLRCLICGFRYSVPPRGHHCENCFSPADYLRPSANPCGALPRELETRTHSLSS